MVTFCERGTEDRLEEAERLARRFERCGLTRLGLEAETPLRLPLVIWTDRLPVPLVYVLLDEF